MEYGTVGNHEVAACPHCDKLFDVPTTEPPVDGLERIQRLYREHLVASPPCKAASEALPGFFELAEELGPMFQRAEEERQKNLDANPDNGKLGYWLVAGIRHDARCRASSAREAVEKCITAGAIGDWESPDATFIAEKLPEVF